MLKLIARDKKVIIYRPEFRKSCGSVTASILLGQLIYWWDSQDGKPFYKFKEPCKHALYKKGDSWTEELGFSRDEFDAAFSRLEKIGVASKKLTMDRRTIYSLNEEKAEILLNEIYSEKRKFHYEPEGESRATVTRKVRDSIYTETTLKDYPETTRETEPAQQAPEQPQPEPSKPATQAARKQKHDVKKMTAAFENLFAEYPAEKGNKPAAAKAWKEMWIERGDERMELGVEKIMQDIHDRASHVKGKYSPFWQTSLVTYITGRMWSGSLPQIWNDKVAPQIANEYRLPDRLKAPVSDVYDDTLDDIPF